jgi:hypothetical protein
VPPLPPITPITIQDPRGNYVRVQNSSDFAWVGNGTGKTPPETFYAYHSNNTGDTTPIMPGQTTILKSDQTGLYCRIQAYNGTDQGMICDVTDPLQASVFTYNYMGLEYNGTQLLADFDDGSSARDALGQLIGQNDTGLGWAEGLIAQGDSGSPAFLDGHLAGIASYTASLSRGVIHPDIDSVQNSSFGEIAAWQRMSAHQQWIDQSLRAAYPDAPAKPEEVRTVIAEGNSGTSYVYFLLQFTGSRSDPNQIISVDYATRDGTATSGSDYVAAEGRLNLYPGETQAVIPVEIIGDTTPEANEYLYLEVFNPVGGSFAAGVTRLTAIRTILDDDNGAFA